MVSGKREEPILGVPSTHNSIDDKAIRFDHVDTIERGSFSGEVAQIQAVGSVASDDVELLELRVKDHIGRRGTGAFDLEVLDAKDPDQVLLVRAYFLLLVAQELIAELDTWCVQVIAGVRLERKTGFLQVDAGQHKNGRSRTADVVHRTLQIPISPMKTLRIQLAVHVLNGGREGRNPPCEIRVVIFADNEMRTRHAIWGDMARAIGGSGWALVVGARDHRPHSDDRSGQEGRHQA